MNIEKTCKSIAKELGLDEKLVHDIVMFEFWYTTSAMKDPDNYYDILFNKCFKFKLKPRFKDNKLKENSPK